MLHTVYEIQEAPLSFGVPVIDVQVTALLFSTVDIIQRLTF